MSSLRSNSIFFAGVLLVAAVPLAIVLGRPLGQALGLISSPVATPTVVLATSTPAPTPVVTPMASASTQPTLPTATLGPAVISEEQAREVLRRANADAAVTAQEDAIVAEYARLRTAAGRAAVAVDARVAEDAALSVIRTAYGWTLTTGQPLPPTWMVNGVQWRMGRAVFPASFLSDPGNLARRVFSNQPAVYEDAAVTQLSVAAFPTASGDHVVIYLYR